MNPKLIVPILGHLLDQNVDGLPDIEVITCYTKDNLAKAGVTLDTFRGPMEIDLYRAKFIGIKTGTIEELYLAIGESETLVLVRDTEADDENVRRGYLWGLVRQDF